MGGVRDVGSLDTRQVGEQANERRQQCWPRSGDEVHSEFVAPRWCTMGVLVSSVVSN